MLPEGHMAAWIPAGPNDGQIPQATTATPPQDPRLLLRQNSQANASRTLKPSTFPSNIATTAAHAPMEASISYGDRVVESLCGISSGIATAVNLEAEQTKVKKSLGVITHQHEKLKGLDQFPAARDLVAMIRASKEDELEHLKNELKTHKDIQLKLAKQAAGLFDNPKTQGQTQQSIDLKAIEADLNSTKRLLGKISDDVAFLKKNRKSQTEETSALKKQINGLTNEVQVFKRDVLDDVEYLNKNCDHEIGAANHRIRELKERFEEVDVVSRRTTDSNRIEDIESQTHQLKKSLPGTVKAIVDMQLKSLENKSQLRHGADDNAVERLTQRLSTLEATLSQFKSGSVHQMPKTDSAFHDPRYDHLQKVLQDLIDLQAYKDDQQMKAIEENDARMEQNLQKTVLKINTEIKSQIETAMQQAMDGRLPKQMAQLHEPIATNESSEMNEQRLQTVETAVASLETRYTSINPHSLVNQTIPIIQQLYPLPHILHNLIEVVKSIQVHVPRMEEFASLPNSVVNLEKKGEILDSRLTHCVEELMKRTDRSLSETQYHKKLVQQELSALKKRSNEMAQSLDSLASVSRENQQRHEAAMERTREISLDSTRITKEVSGLMDHVDQLHNQSHELMATVDQLKASYAGVLDQVGSAGRLEIQAGMKDSDRRDSTISDAYKHEDTRLRLLDVETRLRQQNSNMTEQLKAIQDKRTATDRNIVNWSHASLTQLEQDMESIKERVKRFSEDPRKTMTQSEQERLNSALRELTSEVYQLELAEATLGQQTSAQMSASEPPLSSELMERVQRSASVNLDNNCDNKKKRKRTKSASDSGRPRDSPYFEGFLQRHNHKTPGDILQQ